MLSSAKESISSKRQQRTEKVINPGECDPKIVPMMNKIRGFEYILILTKNIYFLASTK